MDVSQAGYGHAEHLTLGVSFIFYKLSFLLHIVPPFVLPISPKCNPQTAFTDLTEYLEYCLMRQETIYCIQNFLRGWESSSWEEPVKHLRPPDILKESRDKDLLCSDSS